MLLNIFIILSTMLSHSMHFFSAKKTVTVKIIYYQPYCGGARPSPEMEAEAQKPKPYANNMLVFISNTGKVDSALTDNEGVLKLKLKTGTYKVYEKWRYYKSTPNGETVTNYDKACLSGEWAKETCVISISKKTTTVSEPTAIIYNCPWNQPCLREDKKFMPE